MIDTSLIQVWLCSTLRSLLTNRLSKTGTKKLLEEIFTNLQPNKPKIMLITKVKTRLIVRSSIPQSTQKCSVKGRTDQLTLILEEVRARDSGEDKVSRLMDKEELKKSTVNKIKEEIRFKTELSRFKTTKDSKISSTRASSTLSNKLH